MRLLPPLIVLLLLVPARAAAAWRAPVPGPVLERYHHRPGSYAAGERRGVRFAARPGALVVAPCPGPVTWAGAAGAAGPGVTVGCGRLRATLTGLGAAAVRRGAHLRTGDVLGRAGRRGWVQLSARRPGPGDPYLDPLPLLGAAPAPALPAWRRGPARPRSRPSGSPPASGTRPEAEPVRAPRPATWPLALGASLALVGALLGGVRRYAAGGAYRLRATRRKAPALDPSRSARANAPGPQ